MATSRPLPIICCQDRNSCKEMPHSRVSLAGMEQVLTPFRLVPLPTDARWLQIAALSILLLLGFTQFDFDIRWWHGPVAAGAALSAQALGSWASGRRFDPLSALITALSLTLLLRTDDPRWVALAAFAAVGSKFVLRYRGRHLFNPANLGLVLAIFWLPGCWISPGQWGSVGVLTILFIGAGTLVSNRAARLDTAVFFMGCWAAILIGRALWLGDPMAIPLHQLQNGALLLFTFFMITDPMTTPLHRLGRFVHAALVAAVGAFLVFEWFINAGSIWALFFVAPLVPVIDRIWPGPLPRWKKGVAACPASP